MNKMRAIHPGEILREEFMMPMGLSAHAHQRYCSRKARHRAGHRIAVGAVFQFHAAILAEPANKLRPEDRATRFLAEDPTRSIAARCVMKRKPITKRPQGASDK